MGWSSQSDQRHEQPCQFQPGYSPLGRAGPRFDLGRVELGDVEWSPKRRWQLLESASLVACSLEACRHSAATLESSFAAASPNRPRTGTFHPRPTARSLRAGAEAARSHPALSAGPPPRALLHRQAPTDLTALVVANKHLDDNSFRNSTFAAVSGITLPEVNALEYSLLAGLSFDINLHTDTWLAWLQDLENQGTTRFTRERVQVGSIIAPLIRKVVQERHAFEVKQQEQQQLQYGDRDGEDQQDHHPLSYSTSTIASVDMPMPMTPISPPPRSESSWSSVFDMDAAVPIEQRPKYKKAFSHQPEAAASGLSSSWNQTGCAAFPSHSSASVGAANAPTSAHKVGREAYGAEYRRCSDWPPPPHYGYSGPSGRNNLVAA